MELKELSQRAVEIKKKYSQMEMEKFGREWTDAQPKDLAGAIIT